MSVIKTEIPPNSLLSKEGVKYDYLDSYTVLISGFSFDTKIEAVAYSLFSKRIKWIDWLFILRNKIVKLFGFTTGLDFDKKVNPIRPRLQRGDKLELFKVYEVTEEELILGDSDKFIDFRVSILFDSFRNRNLQSVTLSTYVNFKNIYGRVYFFIIKPFHIVIVKALLRRLERMEITKK